MTHAAFRFSLALTLVACGGGGGGGDSPTGGAATGGTPTGGSEPDSGVTGGSAQASGGADASSMADATLDANVPDARPEPTPWLADVGTPSVMPALTDREVEAALAQILTRTVRLNFGPLRSAYDELLTLRDDTCPELTEYEDESERRTHYWEADCETAAGVVFRGAATFGVLEGQLNDDGRAAHGFVLDAGAGVEIIAPDGRGLRMNGYVSDQNSEGDGWHDQGTYASGSYLASGGLEGDDPWLNGELNGEIAFYVGHNPEDTYHAVSATATLADPAPGLTGVLLNEVESSGDSHCDLEPNGDITLRDSGGVWYTIVFDGNPPSEESPEPAETACDGCGAVWVHGIEGGQVCLTAEQMTAFRSWR